MKTIAAALIGGLIGGALVALILKTSPTAPSAPLPFGATGQPGVSIAEGGAVSAQLSACEDELRLYCAFVRPGAGRFKRCLEEHAASLSAACREAVKNLKPSPDGH